MQKQWWKEAVVYQIYPKSFCDSDADGLGDLKGITSRLDYLSFLGVNVLWLCPVYQSPNDDNGYDISDYRDIMQDMGTMADWEELLAGVHQRGMRLIMDLVVNHTSDEHPWFVESKSSKDNSKRDWYIWRPGKNGAEPNNWASFFSPSAWELDAKTGEYYLHLFSRKQPDLNWENPDVRHAVYDIMRFWLDKGIDGFRLDTANMYSKPQDFPDAPVLIPGSPYQPAFMLVCNGPRIHEFVREMNREVLSHYDAMTVGEGPFITPELALQYAGFDTGEFNMVFHFEHVMKGGLWTSNMPYDFVEFKGILNKYQTVLHGKAWNSLYLNNHDQPRQVSRFGNDGPYRIRSAKLLVTLLHMQQGTPYIYQGEELGMTNVPFTSFEQYQDIDTHNFIALSRSYGMEDKDILAAVQKGSRDNARTPMQWDSGENAGFTKGRPWIEVNPNYKDVNVEASLEDGSSILHYYRSLIRLRREIPAIVYGSFRPLFEDHPALYAWVREYEGERLLVVLNFSDEKTDLSLPQDLRGYREFALISNTARGQLNLSKDTLEPWEAYVARLV